MFGFIIKKKNKLTFLKNSARLPVQKRIKGSCRSEHVGGKLEKQAPVRVRNICVNKDLKLTKSQSKIKSVTFSHFILSKTLKIQNKKKKLGKIRKRLQAEAEALHPLRRSTR